MYEVRSDRLYTDGRAVDFRQTPNVGGALKPRFLVMHYTAGRSFESSVTYLCKPEAKASAHLVVGRAGEVAQLAPFDRIAWHAGTSHWHGLSSLNRYAIGIELDNGGKLDRTGAGTWQTWFGETIPAADVIVATHERGGGERGWHIYPKVQIDAALAIAEALQEAYDLEDVIGHDDISWPNKTDPGPAFPMISFRSRVLGRASV